MVFSELLNTIKKGGDFTAEKKSLLLYYDYKSHFDFLTDEQLGKLVRSMLEYEICGVFPEFDEPILKMTFSFIKSNLDRDKQKFFEKCEKNTENGRKGGRPRQNQSNEQVKITDEQHEEQTTTESVEYSSSEDSETAAKKAEFRSKIKGYGM